MFFGRSSQSPKGTQFRINYQNQVLFWKPPIPSARRSDVVEWNVNYLNLIHAINHKWNIQCEDIEDDSIQIKYIPHTNSNDFLNLNHLLRSPSPNARTETTSITIDSGDILCSVWHDFREQHRGSPKVIGLELVLRIHFPDSEDCKEIEDCNLPISPVITNLNTWQRDEIRMEMDSIIKTRSHSIDSNSNELNVNDFNEDYEPSTSSYLTLPVSGFNTPNSTRSRSTTPRSSSPLSSAPITDELDRQNVMDQLRVLGVEEQYIVRTMKLYDKHYRDKHEYSIEIIVEIMYRLKIKDKLKIQKRKQQILFSSRRALDKVFYENFNEIPAHFVDRGITEYLKQFQSADNIVYDLVQILEIIMNFRAEDRAQRKRKIFGAKTRRVKQGRNGHHQMMKCHDDGSSENKNKVLVFVSIVDSGSLDSVQYHQGIRTPLERISMKLSKRIKFKDFVLKMERRLNVDCNAGMIYTVDGDNETILIRDDEDLQSMIREAERGRVDLTVETAGGDDDSSSYYDSDGSDYGGCVQGDMSCIPGITTKDGDCLIL